MDNYNGQNQFGQNQMNQNQYGQFQQAPQQQMYQQPQNYGYGYNNQPNYSQPKSSWWKWLLIIGVPAVVIGVTILIIVLVCSGYDIDDYSDFSKTCEKVLNVEMEKDDPSESAKKKYGVVSYAEGEGELDSNDVESYIQWYKFDSEKAAEEFWEDNIIDRYKSYFKEAIEAYDGKWNEEDDFIEAYVEYEGEMDKIILIREDEYIVSINMAGDSKDVKKTMEKFLDEID